MIPDVTAVRFQKVMSSGRTQPCLLVCETDAGDEIEVVTKLKGNPQLTRGGLVCEVIASLLALELNLPVMPPYRVMIEAEFAATVPDATLRTVFQNSIGWNFGCAKWGPGFTIRPRGQVLSSAMLPLAAEVFAFDGLIQNPDRRARNPNCVVLGDELLLFDHESAFSHLYDLFPKAPWEPGGLRFLNEHVFHDCLRGRTLELDRLQGAVEALDDRRLQSYLVPIPADWDGETITARRIIEYLTQCRSKMTEILNQVQSAV